MLQASFGRNKKWTHNKMGIIYLSEFSFFIIKALQDLWPSVFRFFVPFLLNVSTSCNKSQRVNGAQISELTQTGVGWADAIREHCMHWARTLDWSWHSVFHKTPAQWSQTQMDEKTLKTDVFEKWKDDFVKIHVHLVMSRRLPNRLLSIFHKNKLTLVKIVVRGVLKEQIKNVHFGQPIYLRLLFVISLLIIILISQLVGFSW